MHTKWLIMAWLACAGCAGGTVDDASAAAVDDGSEVVAGLSSSLLYYYVTPTQPGSTAPLALRRANAKPGGLNGGTYGLAIVADVQLAADAHASQAALDAVLAVPFSGHGSQVVAIFGARDGKLGPNGPTFDVVEIYAPSQSVAVSAVQQQDALYQLVSPSGGKVTVRELNEKDYPAGTPAFDYSGASNPSATAAAVQAGAMFTGSIDVSCSTFLWWTKCKPPTGVHAAAYFIAQP